MDLWRRLGNDVHLSTQGPTVGEPGNWRTLSSFTFDGGESSVIASLDPERGERAGRSPLNSAKLAGPTWPSTRTDYPLATVWIATKFMILSAGVRDCVHHHCVQVTPVLRNR